MKIVNNIFLVVLATMLFVQVNCKRGNDSIVYRSELNQTESSIKKEKYKVMFFTYKPRKVKDQTHGNKKQRQN
jgi:uncharacterized lipoprotein YehR (DUF1307 family)